MARMRMVRLLEETEDVEVAGVCASGGEAVAAIRAALPDLVLLDIAMPGMDGFGVIRQVGDPMPPVIFITAHNDRASQAFDARAVDYLLKPFSAARFHAALARARAALSPSPPADPLAEAVAELREEQRALQRRLEARDADHLRWVMVRARDHVHVVQTDAIDWIEAEDNYVRLHVGKASYLVRERIGALEARLDPRRFLRVHRCTIVNLDRVRHLRPWSSGDYLLVMQDGTELRLSRGKRARLGPHIAEYA
jgi:two-component system LytT family response regulator